MSRARKVAGTEILLALGLLAFVGGAYGIEQIQSGTGPVRLSSLAAIALSAIPAMLWLGYFYAQDLHEPEPKEFVLGVYLLGAFVAGPVSDFIIAQVLPSASEATTSLSQFGPDQLVRTFLIVAVAQELCKYAAVRYTIYLSAEFDEPMDGIVYMSAAGIGFATYDNYHYFQGLEREVFLTTGAAHAVVTTLAHACFAGVLGYALGRAKFSTGGWSGRSITLLLGLVVAVILNGQFSLVQGVVKTAGIELHPWRGVAYAAGFAAIVFLVTSILMRRHLAASPFRGEGEAAGE